MCFQTVLYRFIRSNMHLLHTLYFFRNYAVLLVVCCVCSTQLPGRFWQWCKGKAPLRAALCGVCFVLCTAYVVAATGSTALYANF